MGSLREEEPHGGWIVSMTTGMQSLSEGERCPYLLQTLWAPLSAWNGHTPLVSGGQRVG